ncbi:MAG: uroporphyrinogen decarboxylase family protein [Methanomassiliicoccales archaeon]
MVPIFLRDLTLGLDECNYSTPEVCAPPYDAEKSARSVISLQKRLGQDAVVGCIHYVGFDAQSLGGELKFPDRGIPSVIKHPLEGGDWRERIVMPSMNDSPYREALRSYELVSKSLREEAEVVCNLEGPMTKAALLRGLERFAMDIELDRSSAKDVTYLSTQLSIAFLEEAARKGAGTCFLASSTDNPSIFGSEVFRHFSLPGVREITKKAKNLGMQTIFHPHGIFQSPENISLVEDIISTGVVGIQFAEENDLRFLKEICRGKVCVLGGPNVFTTLLFGPEERIERETREYIDKCAAEGGYILMCSCSLHRGMPMHHVEAMIRCCRSYGKYF